jgi:nitrate reductase assembly molybdenum cofactor insertion protein NarJ
MDAQVHALLADAQTWRLISRLLEAPGAGWHADVRALTEGAVADDIKVAGELAREAREADYFDAFGPTGVVSPREVGHCGMRDPGQILADLQARYGAFGYRPSDEETIDHVSVETGFVSYLRLKEAFAKAEGLDEPADIAREAADAFIADHLRDVAAPIAAKLEPVAPSYLAEAARALAARVGEPATRATSKVIWLDDEGEDEMACGEAPGTAG